MIQDLTPNNAPPFTIEQVNWLARVFTPVLHTPGVDIRQIDFRSGQHSVVEFIRLTQERQTKHVSTQRSI